MHKNYTKKILKIQEVSVKKVEKIENSLIFELETKVKTHTCPSCNQKTSKIHDYRYQMIQHGMFNDTTIYLNLHKRRYVCPHCGKRFYENYDFVQKYFRKSNELFKKIILDLKKIKNFKTVASDNHVSIDTVIRFMKYEIFLRNKFAQITILPKHIGIDEFKGNCGKKYLFHIYDLDTHKTVDIVKGKSYDILENYFSKISNKNDISIVSMDMCLSFKRVIQDKFPNAKIVADCFHFTRVVLNCLDELRLNIWRDSKGIDKKYFKGLKHSLMKDVANASEKDKEKLLYAFELSPILKYAYNLKNEFLNIKKATTFEEKEKLFRKWLYDAETSTIKEFKACIKTFRDWHKYISNYFKYNYSNGPTEGKNNLIKVLKRIAFGFRNFDNFRMRILLIDLK